MFCACGLLAEILADGWADGIRRNNASALRPKRLTAGSDGGAIEVACSTGSKIVRSSLSWAAHEALSGVLTLRASAFALASAVQKALLVAGDDAAAGRVCTPKRTAPRASAGTHHSKDRPRETKRLSV